ncbi:hypothetical protein CU669_03310 [Paramagnetospirillum kuznetsovii]|uniref:Spore protein YkvP/CgeB glycosyl transferase-like domain-containing protein n=1 Tax=Paramagnetospirillum kuznetsovii TaxID=2053833 RepID=A0A364P1K6_9PROT|nr:glycosyltransferase [Paramagnetospirillum kuznetsovii]RAU23201.1 hypothetical protein CU669_03310 [Paramagnetospirillum kuznetsovii]
MANPIAPAAMAAIASGWIADEAPEVIADGLRQVTQSWLAQAGLPPQALWRSLAERLHHYGCFDAEIDACRMALSLMPGQSFFQLRLAEMLRRAGKPDDARVVLGEIGGSGPSRCDALLQLLALDNDAATLDALESLLAEDGQWSGRHRGLIEHLVAMDRCERATAFITRWTDRWPIAPGHVFDMGAVAMMIGKPHLARSLFTSIWGGVSGGPDPLIGHFDGAIRPYDETIETELAKRIEAAFALDEADLPVVPLPDDPPPPAVKVVMVSFNHRALPNDLAEHFGRSARDAGVDLHLYLDSAIIMGRDFVGSDGEVANRVDVFVAAMERLRPDVVILDCQPLSLRGVNPAMMVALKARLGFRLACLMRDAHRHAMPLLQSWLPACDAMVMGDPLSQIRQEGGDKVVIVPLPSLHSSFLDHAERRPGLTFVGNIAWQPRIMVLAVLMTEDIAFTAITGARRHAETGDTDAYARLLTRTQANLNVSRHAADDHLVTGRVWETIAAGALLVEQDNPATAKFFTPYRHYLPWTNVEDIVHIAHFIGRRPDLAARIAQDAHDWAKRHYNGHRFWSALLHRTIRTRPPEDMEADRDAAQDWLALV